MGQEIRYHGQANWRQQTSEIDELLGFSRMRLNCAKLTLMICGDHLPVWHRDVIELGK
jgi:hypothetical protein